MSRQNRSSTDLDDADGKEKVGRVGSPVTSCASPVIDQTSHHAAVVLRCSQTLRTCSQHINFTASHIGYSHFVPKPNRPQVKSAPGVGQLGPKTNIIWSCRILRTRCEELLLTTKLLYRQTQIVLKRTASYRHGNRNCILVYGTQPKRVKKLQTLIATLYRNLNTTSRKSALISASQLVQPGTNTTLETTDTGWCIMLCACLLPQLSPGTHTSLPQRAGSF